MKAIAKKTLGCEDCGGACWTLTMPCQTCGGEPVWFDSGSELTEYAELVRRQKGGEIRNLRRQPKYLLGTKDNPILVRSPRYKNGRRAVYTADFEYEERKGSLHTRYNDEWVHVTAEHKGFDTEAARLRRAVFEAQYNTQVRMTGAQKMRRRRVTVGPDVS